MKSPRSGGKRRALGVSPRNGVLEFEPVITGDSRIASTVARYHGLSCFRFFLPWGSRPRLYACARLAGYPAIKKKEE